MYIEKEIIKYFVLNRIYILYFFFLIFNDYKGRWVKNNVKKIGFGWLLEKMFVCII